MLGSGIVVRSYTYPTGEQQQPPQHTPNSRNTTHTPLTPAETIPSSQYHAHTQTNPFKHHTTARLERLDHSLFARKGCPPPLSFPREEKEESGIRHGWVVVVGEDRRGEEREGRGGCHVWVVVVVREEGVCTVWCRCRCRYWMEGWGVV